MKRSILATLAFAVSAACAGPVFADPPGGVPPGLAKKGVSAKEWKQAKGHDDDKGKKGHGDDKGGKGHDDPRHAKGRDDDHRSKGHDDGRHDHDDGRAYDHDRHDRVVVVNRDREPRRVVVVGRPMPQRVDYVIVRDYSRYRVAPPPRGYSYYEADGNLYQVADGTNQVALLLGALTALLR